MKDVSQESEPPKRKSIESVPTPCSEPTSLPSGKDKFSNTELSPVDADAYHDSDGVPIYHITDAASAFRAVNALISQIKVTYPAFEDNFVGPAFIVSRSEPDSCGNPSRSLPALPIPCVRNASSNGLTVHRSTSTEHRKC